MGQIVNKGFNAVKQIPANSSYAINAQSGTAKITGDVNSYYVFNLKNADFVFNSDNNQPVIQLYSQVAYSLTKTDAEAESSEKIKKEESLKPTKEFYRIDKEEKLIKIAEQ